MKVVAEYHIASQRLCELALMSRSIDEPEWEHIWDCVECGIAFLMLKSITAGSATVQTGAPRLCTDSYRSNNSSRPSNWPTDDSLP